MKDLTGQRFGRLVVIERADNKGKNTMWTCKCDCGKVIKTYALSLKNGDAQSCGCLNSELVKARIRAYLQKDIVEGTSLQGIKTDKPLQSNNTSKIRGVSWFSNKNKWVAYISFQKKDTFSGISKMLKTLKGLAKQPRKSILSQ